MVDQNDNERSDFEFEDERIEKLFSNYSTREIHIYSRNNTVGVTNIRNDNNPNMINYIYTTSTTTKFRLKYEVLD